MSKATSDQIPFQDYLSAPGVNNGSLSDMDISPLHYHTRNERERESTDALTDGRLIHSCVLELPLFEATTCLWEGGLTAKGAFTDSKNSTAYKDFKAAKLAEGKEIITPDKYKLCHRVRNAVHSHPVAAHMLEGAQTEISVFWEHPIGIACKSRIDILSRGNYVIDLKTAADITPEGFAKSALNYGYHRQAAFYQDAALALTGELLPYYIIAVEKREPFDVAVYEIGADILAIGRSKYCDSLRKIKECRKSGKWPGVAPTVQTLEFPGWAYTDDDDVLDWTDIGGES